MREEVKIALQLGTMTEGGYLGDLEVDGGNIKVCIKYVMINTYRINLYYWLMEVFSSIY